LHGLNLAFLAPSETTSLCYISGMTSDPEAVGHFYATARGAVAAQLLRARLTAFWPPSELGPGRRISLLGLGYAAPYLRLWRDSAGRCIALTPAQIRAARWPPGAPSLSCIAEEDALPFPDLSFDRVLLVHGLEVAENARRLLREIWRVLKDDGRLLVVAPNRMGIWAQMESTPFGHGQPYSSAQLSRLLSESLFQVERKDTALYVPPTEIRLILRGAKLFERVGRRLALQFAGVIFSEAVKAAYAATPLCPRPRRRYGLVEAG
jgi:SAM-dependent methyltransferase